MSEEPKRPIKSRFQMIAEEPGIGMNNNGELNVVAFDPVLAVERRESTISRLHVPMSKPEDVIPHLGKPSHYRPERSAYCLANSWIRENELPELVRLTLDTTPALAGAKLIEGFFERECCLGDGGRHSQTDLLALLSVGNNLVVMSVEGKVDEPFGELVIDELRAPTSLKKARIERLSALLGLSAITAEPLRYQLIHRTAAAIYEAQRFHARTAVMMVHSFDGRDTGADDYRRFAEALKFEGAAPTLTVGPKTFGEIELYLGWTADRTSNEGYYIKDRRKTDEGLYDDE